MLVRIYQTRLGKRAIGSLRRAARCCYYVRFRACFFLLTVCRHGNTPAVELVGKARATVRTCLSTPYRHRLRHGCAHRQFVPGTPRARERGWASSVGEADAYVTVSGRASPRQGLRGISLPFSRASVASHHTPLGRQPRRIKSAASRAS